MNKEKLKEQVDLVIERFDFIKVHKAMRAVGWTYHDGAPTVGRLVNTARELLRSVAEHGHTSCATGGFTASAQDDILHLEFCMEAADGEQA